MILTTKELDQAYAEAMNTKGYINTITDTEYRIDINKDLKIVSVCFEGSGSKIDWKQNFSFWQKPYKNMKHTFYVHSGLLNKYKSVNDNIFKIILPFLNPDWKVRGYGFSQGAGLITFFHEDVKYRLPSVDIKTYAFAPPKTFTFINRKFLNTRFETLYTIINKNDIVPKVPFWWMGFIHYGNKIKLGKFKLIVTPWNIVKEHMRYKELF